MVAIFDKYPLTILIAVAALIAVNGTSASDLDEPGDNILPTGFPGLTPAWATEHCDFIADDRVTVDAETLSEYPSAYIALAKAVDREVEKIGANAYIWVSIGRSRNRERIDDDWDTFVEIEAWECEQSPRKSWQELKREHWPELTE